MAAVHLLTDQLVAEAEKLTAAFDAQAHVSTARIVNISGRQRIDQRCRIARSTIADSPARVTLAGFYFGAWKAALKVEATGAR